MSDYTNTFTKTTGDTVEASDFSTEFDAIEVSSATKADESGATLTTATLTSPKINEILDTNGNELVKFTTTGSAVNEITVTNAATGNNPAFTASGEDVGIDVEGVTFKNGAVTAVTSITDSSSNPISGAVSFVTATAIGAVTAKNYTGVPTWAKKITIGLSGVSTNGSSAYILTLGDSGGIETSGYTSYHVELAASSTILTATAHFLIVGTPTSGGDSSGIINLVLQDSSTNTWVMSSSATELSFLQLSSGVKSLSSAMTQFTLTTGNGTDAFDAGSVSILYEG